VFSFEGGEGELFPGVEVLEGGGVVGAFNEACGGVVAADFIDEGLVGTFFAFCDEDEVGAGEVFGGFTEGASGDEMTGAEGLVVVDEYDVGLVL